MIRMGSSGKDLTEERVLCPECIYGSFVMQMTESKKDWKCIVVRCVKAAAFAVLALFMMYFISRLLIPKWLGIWNASKTDTQFYKEERNSMDLVFMGSSCGSSSIDPIQLFDETGIMSYDLCNNAQPLLSTYFWLNEVLKTQKPKMIVLEVVAIGLETAKEEMKARRSYEYMKWGRNKLNYAKAYVDAGDGTSNLLSYLFPLYMYHTRWDSLSRDDFAFMMGENGTMLRGYTPNRTTLASTEPDFEYTGLDGSDDETLELLPSNKEYLQKIIDLCREKEIGLLLLKTCDSRWLQSSHDYIAQVAEENGVPFLDMNLPEIVEESGIVMRDDAMDTRHLNLRGARKTTEYLGKYLREHTDLPDRRGETRYENIISKSREYHDSFLEDLEFCFIDDFQEYFSSLARLPRYEIFVAGAGAEGELTEEEKAALKELGLPEKFLSKPLIKNTRIMIKANTSENTVSCRRGGKDRTEYGKLSTGVTYETTASAAEVSIRIDGKEYALEKSGINVVVYDTVIRAVSDRFMLDFKGDNAGIKIKRG